MQLGEISTLVVGDLKVAVIIEWGQLRKTIKTVNQAETNAAVMDAVTEALTKHVVGIEGLTDAKGKAVSWSAATLDKLPPWPGYLPILAGVAAGAFGLAYAPFAARRGVR